MKNIMRIISLLLCFTVMISGQSALFISAQAIAGVLPENLRVGNYLVDEQFTSGSCTTTWSNSFDETNFILENDAYTLNGAATAKKSTLTLGEGYNGVYGFEVDLTHNGQKTLFFEVQGTEGIFIIGRLSGSTLRIDGSAEKLYFDEVSEAKLRFLFYTETGKFSAWVGDEQILDMADAAMSTALTKFYIYFNKNAAAASATVDNIKFYKAYALEEDRIEMDMEWLTEEQVISGSITESFLLPERSEYGSYIEWSSSDSDIIEIDGCAAKVKLPAEETDVTLTAHLSADGETWIDSDDFRKALTFTVQASGEPGDNPDDENTEKYPEDVRVGDYLINEDFQDDEYEITWSNPAYGSVDTSSGSFQLIREANTPKKNKTATIIPLNNGESLSGIYGLEADIASSSATINFRVRGAAEAQYVNVTLHNNGNLGINGADADNSYSAADCTGNLNLKFLFYSETGAFSAWVNGEKVLDKATGRGALDLADIYIYTEHATNAQTVTLDNLKFYEAKPFSTDGVTELDAVLIDNALNTEEALTENLTLPKAKYGSEITWEITEDESGVAELDETENTVKITPVSKDAVFTLEVTISKEDETPIEKSYTFTVNAEKEPDPLPEEVRQGNYLINEEFAGNTYSTVWNEDLSKTVSDEKLKIVPPYNDTAELEMYLDADKKSLKGTYGLEMDLSCNLKTFKLFVVGKTGRFASVTLNKAALGINGSGVDSNGNETSANKITRNNQEFLDGVTLRFLFYTDAGKFSAWVNDEMVLDMADSMVATDLQALQFQLADAGDEDTENIQVATVDNIRFYKAKPFDKDLTTVDASYINEALLADVNDTTFADGKISKDLTLPERGEYGSYIEWSILPENLTEAVLDGNTVKITRAESEPEFTLTAKLNLENGVWNDDTSFMKKLTFKVAPPHTDDIVTCPKPTAEKGYIIKDSLKSEKLSGKIIVTGGSIKATNEGLLLDSGDSFTYMLGSDGKTYNEMLALSFSIKGVGTSFGLYDEYDTKVFGISVTDDGLCVDNRSGNNRTDVTDKSGLSLVKTGVTEADLTIAADPITGLFSLWCGEEELVANARLGADDCSKLEYIKVEHSGSTDAVMSELGLYYPTFAPLAALSLDSAALTLESLTWQKKNAVIENITLPQKGRAGSKIEWVSSDEAIEVDGKTGIVTPNPDADTTVTMTANLTFGEKTWSADFDLTVPGVSKSQIPDIKELIYEESFEGNNTSTVWSHTPSVGQIYVKNERLYFKRNTQVEASATKSYYYFDKNQQSKQGIYGFECTVWNKYKTMKFKIEGVSDDIVFSNLTLNPSNGNATYRDNNGNVQTISIDCTERIGLRFLFNTDEETFSLWVNGELKLDNVKTATENTSAGLKRIYTYINAEGEQEAQIDNIRFYEAYPMENDRVRLDMAWLQSNTDRLTKENDPMKRFGMVSENLTLPTRGEYGSYIKWEASNDSVTIDGETGVINTKTESKEVTLTAKFSPDGIEYNESDKLDVSFVVAPGGVESDEAAVNYVKSILTAQTLAPYEDLSDGGVKRSLSLPREGLYGCSISWSSGDTYYIDSVGRVTRPRYDEEDKTVILTATVTRGSVSQKTEIPVVVLKDKEFTDPGHMSDEEFFGKWDSSSWALPGKFDYESYPGLSKVEAAAKTGDYTLAKAELLNYFRGERDVPKFTAPSRNSGWANMVTDDFQHLQTTAYYRGSLTVGSEWGKYSTSIRTSDITSSSQICFSVRAWYNEDSYAEFANHTADSDKKPVLELVIDGTTHAFPAVDSVTVRAGNYKDKNYSGEEYLKAANYGDFTGDGLWETYLKFDVSSVTGEEVKSARLVLYGHSSAGQEKRLIVLYHNDNTWNSKTLTWGAITQLVYSYNGLGDRGESDSGLPDSTKFPMERWTTFIEANNSYGQISRFNSWAVIAYEYALSKDEKYAYKAMKIAQDFITTTGGFTSNGTSNKSRGVFKSSWDHGEGGELKRGAYDTTLTSSIRSSNWLNAMKVLINSEYMTPDFLTATLKSVWDTADYLTVYNSGKGNWMNTEMEGLKSIATNVPEFKNKDEWVTQSNKFLAIQLFNNTFADGSYIESTEAYGHGSLKTYIAIKRDLMANGIDVNEVCADLIGTEDAKGHIINDTYDERLQKLAYYQILLYAQDGTKTQYGDSGYGIRNAGTWNDVYRWFDDKELEYIATYGKSGTKPSWTSMAFYDSGITTMRGSWSKNSPFLFTNVRGGGAHGHRDYNSITLIGYGNTLIADSGYFEYDTTDDYRQYGVSTEAHNTVLINDTNQASSYHSKTSPAPSTGTIHGFNTNSAFDYLQQSTPNNYSYGTHMRTITYLKSDLFIVSDRMIPKEGNDGSNNYKQTWHMYPEANISIDADGRKIRSDFDENGNVLLVSADDNTELKLKDGWCAKLYSKVEDAPYAYYEVNNSGETRLDTVIMTMPEGRHDNVDAVKLETSANATALKLDISQDSASYTGYYLLSYDGKGGEFGPYVTDAEMAYIQLDKNGDIYRITLKGGTYIKEKESGEIVFKSDKEQTEFSADFSGREMLLVGDAGTLKSAEIKAYSNMSGVYIGDESYSYNLKDGYVSDIGNGSILGGEDIKEVEIGGVSGTVSGGGAGGSGGGGGESGGKEEKPKDSDKEENPENPDKANFPDVKNHWAKAYIDNLHTEGIVTGDDKGNFNPDNSITRAEFTAIVTRALKLEKGEYDTVFKDVSETDWYAGSVFKALTAGLISKDTLFRPNDPITRQEMAKIITVAAKLSEKYESTDNTLNSYSDKDSISAWAADYVSLITASGLMQGRDNGNFAPLDNSTRAEATAVICRMIDILR